MTKLVTALLGAALSLASVASAQNSQELPSAPSAIQPRFPGAPAQPPPRRAPTAPASTPGDATSLTTLPAATAPKDAAKNAAQDAAPAQPATDQQGVGANPGANPGASSGAGSGVKPGSGKSAVPKSGDPASLFPPPPVQPAAQTPLKPEETGEFRIGVEVDLVDLIFTATDKHGRFIKDLKKDDIRLLDEGKPPLHVDAFESETGLPLRVGLLIDSSNSIRDRFRFEQDAAVEFLHQVVR